MTVKERLEQYIKEDKIYQDFIDSKVRIKDLTDFDLYCINHCSDIEELLKENKELKSRINKALNKINNMFNRGDGNTIIDDLLELEKTLKGSDNDV